jgi:transcriptional regulator EpsA
VHKLSKKLYLTSTTIPVATTNPLTRLKWKRRSSDGSYRSELITAMESLDLVSSQEEFIAWTKTDFKFLLPHNAFVACMGKVLDFGVKPISIISANYSAECLEKAHFSHDSHHTFMMQNWIESGAPQLFDLSLNTATLDLGCLIAFRDSGLRNIAAHGVFDIRREHVTFFSFYQLPSPPCEEQGKLLKLIVPAMSAAFLRCINPEPQRKTSFTQQALTPRENEVLDWICKGKTNSEIASILEISPNTVKNQAQMILIKLKVNTRAQAVAVAMQQLLASIDN